MSVCTIKGSVCVICVIRRAISVWSMGVTSKVAVECRM